MLIYLVATRLYVSVQSVKKNCFRNSPVFVHATRSISQKKKLLSSSVSTVVFYVAVLLNFSAGNLSAKWLAKNLFLGCFVIITPVGRDVTSSINYTVSLSTLHNLHTLTLK